MDNKELVLSPRAEMLINNDLNWYVVTLENGDYELIHDSGLSKILQCGEPLADFGYTNMDQCWNGEDYSDEDDWVFK